MRRSKTDLYVHFVWATMGRVPLLQGAVEESVRACIVREAADLRCGVLGMGNADDHIHVVVRLHATVAAAALAKQMRGASSRLLNASYTLDEPFRWQNGYGAFTLSRNHVDRAVRYATNQRTHHATGHVWDAWEETDEQAPDPGDVPPDASATAHPPGSSEGRP